MIKDFFLNNYSLITHLVEIFAAISGSFYLYKNKDKTVRFFVYYLWVTVVIENLSIYARFMRNNFDNEIFIALKNSPICTNHWLYNVRAVIIIILLGAYYKAIIRSNNYKKSIEITVVLFSIFSIFYLIFSDSFFYNEIPYGFMIETLIISFYVCLYYLNVIKSENVLSFYKSKHFYFGTILLLWSLAITPLFIFQGFNSLDNPNFIELRRLILLFANIIMYLCFTIVFLLPGLKTK